MPKLNRRHFLAATGVAAASTHASSALAAPVSFGVTDLRAEQTTELLGTQVREPRLSWRLTGSERGLMQTSYRIRAASTPDTTKADLWDSGIVTTSDCFDIPYKGSALKSMQRVWWSVEITDRFGAEKARSTSTTLASRASVRASVIAA